MPLSAPLIRTITSCGLGQVRRKGSHEHRVQVKKALIGQGMYGGQPSWDFPGGPVVKAPCFYCRAARVQSLARELKSFMSRETAKTKTKTKNRAILSGLTIQEGIHLDLPEILNTMNEG